MEKRKISMGFLNTAKFHSEIMCNDKASSTYLLEKERFIKDLLQFHAQRGSPLNRIPRLNGKPLDLYTLYLTVTRNGGWDRVTNEEKWFEVLSSLDFNKSCGNADFALRQIYIKYLHHYEKVHYFGQEVDSREELNESEEGSRKKTTNHIGGVAFSYNHQQHNISDSAREHLGVTRDSNLMFNANYSSLEKSLASGLPNEVDFAINVCLLLSNDAKHVLKGPKSVKVVELLLSHVGIFKHGPSAYTWHFENDTNLNFQEFWMETVRNENVLQIFYADNLISDKADVDSQPEDVEVAIFERQRPHLGMKDREGQRITQVVHIVRNFLVDDENIEALASSDVLFRFLMLCSNTNFGCIKQLGLDALSYLSSKIILNSVDCRMTRLTLRLISRCVHSVDKFEIIRGCDLIGQLSQSNEDSLCAELDESLYSVLIQLLTLHDLQLLLASLEALYQLSENGHVPCNAIVSVHKSIDTLLALLTIDAHKQLLTSDLLDCGAQPEPILSPPAISNNVSHPIVLPGNITTNALPNAFVTNTGVPINTLMITSNNLNLPIIISTTNVAPPISQLVLPIVNMTNNVTTNVTTNVMTNGIVAPVVVSSAATITQDSSPVSIPPEPVPPQATAMIANFNENEKTAFNWLTSQYEFASGSDVSLSKMEMFRKYISECSIHGLQKVVSPTSFENCIKAAFPYSKIVSKDNSTDFSFCGIVKKTSLSKQGMNQSFPAIEQVLNPKTPSNDEKLLEGLDKDLLSIAADAGIEIVADLPLKPSWDSQNVFVDAPQACAPSETSLSPQSSLLSNQFPVNTQNSSNQLPPQQASTTTTSVPIAVKTQQIIQQQLTLQKIMPSPQTTLPIGLAQNLPIINQVVGQAPQLQQFPLNANIINTVLAQQSRFHPPTTNSGGLTVLQAQLLKQMIESQRLASSPLGEQKFPIPPTSPPPGDAKKRKISLQSSPLVRPVKKKKGDSETPFKYYCEWTGCEGLVFEKFSGIYQHMLKQHFEEQCNGGAMVCMWSGCDGMPRQKWSFMAHILERHLNENVLKLWSLKHVDPSTNMPPHPPSTMYPPNAALQAIRRFSARPPFAEFTDIQEETTSKHIHLTAALILRNLARYSAQARSLIKKHESRVAFIAFSDTESSCALSSCLYELHHFKN